MKEIYAEDLEIGMAFHVDLGFHLLFFIDDVYQDDGGMIRFKAEDARGNTIEGTVAKKEIFHIVDFGPVS